MLVDAAGARQPARRELIVVRVRGVPSPGQIAVFDRRGAEDPGEHPEELGVLEADEQERDAADEDRDAEVQSQTEMRGKSGVAVPPAAMPGPQSPVTPSASF
jgi:hypothetical protein